MSETVQLESKTWISNRAACRILGIDYRTLPKVAEKAGIRRRALPGMLGSRYHRFDVERVARESTSNAEMTKTGTTSRR